MRREMKKEEKYDQIKFSDNKNERSTHGNHVLGSLELPESDIDGDTTLTLSLELVEHPR